MSLRKSEASVIRVLYETWGRCDTGLVSLDDASAHEVSGLQLVTTDLLIEGVHFLRDRISARDLGYKVLAVNLSDVAAMGGRPDRCYLSWALPPWVDLKWVGDFAGGMAELARAWGVALAGGDTTRSPSALFINVTQMGWVHPTHLKGRSGARAGHVIAVTGALGDAAAGLEVVLRPELERLEQAPALLGRHRRPSPRVPEGAWLGSQAAVTAMMDLSDGLLTDLAKLCAASGVGTVVDLAKLPQSQELRVYCAARASSALDLSLTGGEDYELLVTVRSEDFEQVAHAYRAEFGSLLTPIGEISESRPGVEWLLDGRPYVPGIQAFSHFPD